MFYDEQPYKLKVALRQRLRWSKGHLQSAVENCPKLLRNMVNPKKNFTIAYDSFFLNFHRHIESLARKIIVRALELTIAILVGSVYGWATGLLIGWLTGIAKSWIGAIVIEICVFIKYHGEMEKTKLPRRIFHVLMFPFFDVIGKWTTYIALFKKIEWKPIPHDTVMDMEKLKSN